MTQQLRVAGLRLMQNSGKSVAYWRATKQMVAAGYPVKSARLWSGSPDTAPTDEERASIESQCRKLQTEMREWAIKREQRGRRARNEQGLVYFVRCNGLVKIGFTSDLPARLNGLQAMNASPIELLGTAPGSEEIERFLHWAFRDLHERAEWFRLDADSEAFLMTRIISSHRDGRWRKPRVRTNKERTGAWPGHGACGV